MKSYMGHFGNYDSIDVKNAYATREEVEARLKAVNDLINQNNEIIKSLNSSVVNFEEYSKSRWAFGVNVNEFDYGPQAREQSGLIQTATGILPYIESQHSYIYKLAGGIGTILPNLNYPSDMEAFAKEVDASGRDISIKTQYIILDAAYYSYEYAVSSFKKDYPLDEARTLLINRVKELNYLRNKFLKQIQVASNELNRIKNGIDEATKRNLGLYKERDFLLNQLKKEIPVPTPRPVVNTPVPVLVETPPQLKSIETEKKKFPWWLIVVAVGTYIYTKED